MDGAGYTQWHIVKMVFDHETVHSGAVILVVVARLVLEYVCVLKYFIVGILRAHMDCSHVAHPASVSSYVRCNTATHTHTSYPALWDTSYILPQATGTNANMRFVCITQTAPHRCKKTEAAFCPGPEPAQQQPSASPWSPLLPQPPAAVQPVTWALLIQAGS